MSSDSLPRWAQGIERLLNRVASQVRGNQDYQADRIADVIQQIDELRTELAEIKELNRKLEGRVDKASAAFQTLDCRNGKCEVKDGHTTNR